MADGSFTPNIEDVLDDYIDDFNWAAKRIDDDDDYNGLWNIIDGNLNDWSQPVIVLVDTSYLPYYNGKQYLHYIVVDGLTQVIDDSTSKPVKSESTVSIVDPNNQSNNYYGNRTVKFNDLFDAAVGYFDDGEQYYNLVW